MAASTCQVWIPCRCPRCGPRDASRRRTGVSAAGPAGHGGRQLSNVVQACVQRQTALDAPSMAPTPRSLSRYQRSLSDLRHAAGDPPPHLTGLPGRKVRGRADPAGIRAARDVAGTTPRPGDVQSALALQRLTPGSIRSEMPGARSTANGLSVSARSESSRSRSALPCHCLRPELKSGCVPARRPRTG